MPPVSMVRIGIDVGQKVDPTAIAVMEVERRGPAGERHYVGRHLERLPLGTSYVEVASRLREIVDGVRGRLPAVYIAGTGYEPAPLDLDVAVDATGVGQPVVDLLAAVGVTVTPVYFTHGDRRTEERGQVTLGKAWLVSRLKTLFQTRCVHLPATAEAEAMQRELLDYEIRVSEDANERYGAFRVGGHDDLVTAIGLAVQAEEPPVATAGSWLPKPPERGPSANLWTR